VTQGKAITLKNPGDFPQNKQQQQDVPELMAKVLRQMTPKKTRKALAKYLGSSST
jgi:hypothetical protein